MSEREWNYEDFMRWTDKKDKSCLLVEELSFDNHFMDKLPDEILMFKNLILLSFESCGIKELPKNIGELNKLQFILAYENKISHFPDSMKELKELEIIDFSSNSFNHLPNLNGFKKLMGLYFNDNKIENIENINELTKIINIQLAGNQLISFPDLSHLKLNFLNLSNNKLTSLEPFKNFTKNTYMFLRDNNFDEKEKALFSLNYNVHF